MTNLIKQIATVTALVSLVACASQIGNINYQSTKPEDYLELPKERTAKGLDGLEVAPKWRMIKYSDGSVIYEGDLRK